jgi:hypothetical protein
MGFSQQPVTLVLGKSNNLFINNTIQIHKDLTFSLYLTDIKNYTSRYLLVIYNPMTQMNDHYVNVGNNYYSTNTKSFPIYNFDGGRIDSMSPSGVRDLGSGIVNGLVNTLLKKI